ncbi:MAG: Mov34/MPN/PAD-1 family protein, partial [Acidobacteriaceae bacterium]|nr:Mov34/MPN/PAD-1 family protein [Acidobacteriaceae bacterium]
MSERRACLLGAGVSTVIRRHGEETFPHECCGALIGKDGVVTAAVPLPNTTEEGPRRRFLVRPSDYMAAERAASAHGG